MNLAKDMFKGRDSLVTGILAAQERCLAHGKNTGNEYAVALDEEGNVLVEKAGEQFEVSFEETQLQLLLHKAFAVIHNHPTGGSLSTQDLMMSTRFNAMTCAVCEDGSEYWSSGFKQDSMGLMLPLELNQLNSKVIQWYLGKTKSYHVDDEGQQIINHMMNLAMDKAGMLADYYYNLGTKAVHVMEKLAGHPPMDAMP